MNKTIRWGGVDWLGAALVALIGGGMFAFRELAIVPRATVGICAAANPPGFCLARADVLSLQYHQIFGWVALAIGVEAFFGARRLRGALAVGLGIAAVVNYNATTGIIGAALGFIAWMSLITGRTAR